MDLPMNGDQWHHIR